MGLRMMMMSLDVTSGSSWDGGEQFEVCSLMMLDDEDQEEDEMVHL